MSIDTKVAVVGVGLHGGRIATALLDRGGVLVGAVDPAHAGTPLAEVLGHPSADATPVAGTVAELLAAVTPELAIVTAPVDLEGLAGLIEPFFAAGIDVLTIHPDAFDPPAEWAARVDAAARAGGASFLSTGVQDVWWVHVPAVAAAATSALRRVELWHATDLDSLSLGLGELFGVGRPVDAFDGIRDDVLLSEESVMGGPMRVLARRLGLTPGPVERRIEPLTATVPLAWPSAERTVAPGRLIGFVEDVRVPTAEGVELVGTLRTALLAHGELPTDRVVLHGDPVLHLEHRPFPGDRITDQVPISRIPDLRAAPPGLHTAATLPPAGYHHPAPTDRRGA